MRPLKLKPKIRPRDTLRGSKAAPKRSELDKLCRQVVFQRDGCACRRCGRTHGKLDWAHIYSRRFLSTRWLPLNSLVLCSGCHFYLHQHPIEAGKFFSKAVGDGYNLLRLANVEGGTPDRLTTKLGLLQMLKEGK